MMMASAVEWKEEKMKAEVRIGRQGDWRSWEEEEEEEEEALCVSMTMQEAEAARFPLLLESARAT
jgi:hypothetical protein